jgi:hypothetical protein
MTCFLLESNRKIGLSFDDKSRRAVEKPPRHCSLKTDDPTPAQTSPQKLEQVYATKSHSNLIDNYSADLRIILM